MKIWFGGVNIEGATAVLMSHGVEPSLPVRLPSLGVRKVRAPLHAAFVTISFRSTIWRAPKAFWITGT